MNTRHATRSNSQNSSVRSILKTSPRGANNTTNNGQSTNTLQPTQTQQNQTPRPTKEVEEMEVDEESVPRGNKRKLEENAAMKKQPKLDPKNPVLLLNELKPGLEYVYDCSQGNPSAPFYKCTVTVNGLDFEGEAGSKKEARQKAAENALRQQITAQNNDIYEKLAKKVTGTPPNSELSHPVDQEKLLNMIENFGTPVMAAQTKHPVMLLNEILMRPLSYECIKDEAGEQKQKYTMRVMVNDEAFEGTARNMKAAKAEAARLALAKLYNVYTPEVEVGSTSMSLLKDTVSLLADIHKSPFSFEEVGENDPTETGVSHVRVVINGHPFEEKGKTKAEAMARVAHNVLANVYGLTGEVPITNFSGVSLFQSPIIVLQHYHGPQTSYNVTGTGGGNNVITATVHVNGDEYTGTGKSETAAKYSAARSALSQVYSITIPSDEDSTPVLPLPKVLARKANSAAPRFPSFNSPPSNCFAPLNVRTPSQVLQEKHNAPIVYNCIKEDGPPHSRTYTMEVHVNDVPYQGVGRSKKEGKNEAARMALEAVYSIVMDKANSDAATNGGFSRAAPSRAQFADTHPVMLLNQLSTEKLQFTCTAEDGPVHDRIYSIQVDVQGQTFTGEGRNKKDAKAAAARSVLAALYSF